MKSLCRFGLVGMVASALLAGSVAVAQENVIVVSVLDYYEGLEGLGNATITIEQLLPAGGPPPMTDSIVFLPVPSNAVLKITANPVNVGSHQSFAYKWMGDVPESYVERNPPHPATILVSMGGEDKNIELLLSREYHPGEKKGDLDLDGLPDEWEVKYELNPEDPTDRYNDTGDTSMPTGWNYNEFASGSYPADPLDLYLDSAYVPHIGGAWYHGSEPFTLWLECRGFDGWYGANPLLGGINDDPGSDPRKLDTSNDGVPDGWQYWFYASAFHNADVEGVKLDLANYTDVNAPAPTVPIPNATIVSAFKPTRSLAQDLDQDCASDGTKTDAAAEYEAGTDPLHWDTDADEISDGYEIRMGLNPTDSSDATANSSGDYMASDGAVRHNQVYVDYAYDPRTGWGENYLGKGTVRELKGQENTVAFNNREKFKASVYLAVLNSGAFSCAGFNDYALDPFSIDTDGDGIFDGWELYVGLNPKNADDGIEDGDGDGLTSFQEFSALDINLLRGVPWPNGSQHFDAVWLNKVWPSDPNVTDTDGDGLGDGAEGGYKDLEVPDGGDTATGSLGVLKYCGGEIDWNGSCYVGGGLNPTSVDTDGEGLPDPWESVSYHISRTFDFADQANRNGMDGTVKDAGMDYDNDGLVNYQEYLTGATYHWRYSEWSAGGGLGGYDPMDFFTGTPYAWDWHLQINKCDYFYVPKYGDNTKVYYSSTSPRDEDTDWDGMDDYWEIYHGLDPVFGVRDVHQSMLLDGWVAVSEPVSYDARVAPYGAGSPFADPDQDGLPNSEESLQANAVTPYYYHTDPSPSWMTDISYQLSFVNLYYDLGSLATHWYFGSRLAPPSYMYSFEDNEGFDTDHDMAGDRAEIVALLASPGSTDPLDMEMPIRRRAIHFDGNAAARTRGNFLHDHDDLTEFTVEAWVKAEIPAKGEIQVVVERPVYIPNGNIMGHPEGIRRNFRIALDPDGMPFASYTGAGYDGLEYQDVIAQSTFPLEEGIWYHLAAVFDGSRSKLFLYIDGQMRASIETAERPINGWSSGNPAWVFDSPLVVGAADRNPEGRINGMPIWVGGGAGTTFDPPDLDNFFEGWVDELRIWNNAKSTEEILRDMNLPLGLEDVARSRSTAVTDTSAPELMYLYNFDNLLDPNLGDEGVVPVGFNVLNGRPDDGSYPHVPWWGTAPDRSLVYNDYTYVPWIVNLASRAPLDPPADSPFNIQTVIVTNSVVSTSPGDITTNTVGTNTVITTNTLTTTNFVVTTNVVRSYPNTANPYNLAYYHANSAAGEMHPDGFQDVFTPVRSPLFNDLLPLRFARVDASVELWDGAGQGTSPTYDTNEDGIPDAWEIANGFDPTGPSIAEEDPDGDGISNYWEYHLGTDPHGMYSMDPNMSDAQFDSDGDGISNIDEITVWGTDPANPDTDDDGQQDNTELEENTSPLYSRSPMAGRSMRLDGVPVSVPEPRKMTEGVMGPQRFEALAKWYVCAMVRPEAGQTGSLVRRTVSNDSKIHFELGLNNNVPYVRFSDLNGTVHTASGSLPLPTDRFSSLIAQWSPSNHVLRLLVDDCVVGAKNVLAGCAKGRGQTVIGDGVNGWIDDVYIGPILLGGRIPTPDYILMIDVSGSMSIEGRMEQAKEAALVAIANLPEDSEMAIVTFDHQVQAVLPFTDSEEDLEDFVNLLTPLGATSYSAPVTQMITLMTDRGEVPGGYIGILISDGEPNSGVPTDADLANAIALGAKINSVGFGSSILAGSTYELERIAALTSGTFFPAPSGDELASILTALVTAKQSDDTCFYPFDDGGTYAEDFTQPLKWEYALQGMLIDNAVYSRVINPFGYAFVDFEDELPGWWQDWFLKGSDETGQDDDPDGDGLSNLNEWRITLMSQITNGPALSPMLPDSNGDGRNDGDSDHDGDSLISKDEDANHECRVDREDTDDDGRMDNQELAAATKPSYSMIPYVMRALRFGAGGGMGEVTVADRVRGVDTEHLGAEEWTLECFVQPDAVPAAGILCPLIQRRLRCSDLINYELGIRNNGSNQIVPYVRYNHFNDTNLVMLTTGVQLAVNEWAHLAARLSDGRLTLFLNGEEVRQMNTSFDPAQGPGDIYFGGNGFAGRLRDLRIWKIGRQNGDIRKFMERSLIFGLAAADPGLLRVVGDEGHLREVAAPGTARDQLRLWTLECWVRTSDTEGTIISRVNTGNSGAEEDDYNYYLGVQGGRLVGKFSIQYREITYDTNGVPEIGQLVFNTAANTLISAQPINDGKWHHVAYTRDSEYAVLYIDGELAGIQDGFLLPGSVTADLQDDDIRILEGPVELGRQLAGDIDEARIWGRALTWEEVRESMEQNLFGNERGLVTYFNFDFQQGIYAEDRAWVRNPGIEYGTYIPGAALVRTTDQAPMEDFHPLRVYAFRSLLGYYPVDDGGETLENLLYQNNWDYAGRLSGDVQFEELGELDQPVTGDSDGDGMPDWWETLMGLNPGSSWGDNGAYGDPDHDGLNNEAEWLAGTSPFQYDTDGDGLSDYDSPPTGTTYGSLYMDGDHMPDEWEISFSHNENHLLDDPSIERYDDQNDPDGDGWDNLAEYLGGGYELVSFASGEGTNDTGGSEMIRYFNEVDSTDPTDVQSFTVPAITFTFIGNCTPPVGAQIVVQAYSNPEMRRPDAVHTISNRFVNGLTETVRLWNGGITPGVGDGHVLQGPNIFMAFIDANADGIYNAGEWIGFGSCDPENIQWGEAQVRIALTDKPAGYIRFSWEQQMDALESALAQVNGTTYLVEIMSLTYGGTVFLRTNDLESMTRAFITEKDLQAAGVSPMDGSYKWLIGTANGTVYAEGYNYLEYPATLTKPIITLPNTLLYAQEKLGIKLDPKTTQIQILIQNAATGESVLNTTQYRPYVDLEGNAEIDLPLLAGFGSFTNGEYYIQVRAYNPQASSNSDWVNFGVLLRPPAQGGVGAISGVARYLGWDPNAKIVVEAYAGSGFDQKPAARVHADADGSYMLLGLPIGTYSVRAFHDFNGNGELDDGESWGLVKGAREDGAAQMASIYTVDYSPKRIDVASSTLQAHNHLVIHDIDADKDLLPDMWEHSYAGNLTAMNGGSDYNGDGLLDIVAFWNGTNPTRADTDGDGLPDWWEIKYGLDPNDATGINGASGDFDGDGVSNAAEYAAGTVPSKMLLPEVTGGRVINAGTHIALGYTVQGVMPMTVVVESTTALDMDNWQTEYRTTLYKSGSYTNVVPTGSASGLHKYFRIRMGE